MNPAQLKLALAGGILAAAALAATTIWALAERAGRLELKAELVRAEDQVDVLADRLGEQSRAIKDLGQATHRGRLELRRIVERVAAGNQAAAATIARLQGALAAPTPAGLDCRAALKQWRAELGQ